MERDERPTGAADTTATAAPARQMPDLAGVTHRFVDLPGLRMHVAEAGSGEPVLLLHGFPQSWWEWRKVMPGLADRYRVICPDLRGAGWTDAPPTGYDREQLLADVVALMGALDVERPHLLTHDWSSLVAYHLCLRSPDRVADHLALAIPPPLIDFDARVLVPFMRYGWYNTVIGVPGLGPLAFARGRQRIPRYMLRRFTADPRSMTEADEGVFLQALREPARARAASALYRNFILPEAGRTLRGAYRRGPRLRTPTRVLIGAEDAVMRADLVHGHEPFVDDLEIELVDGASHFVADDRPDVVVDRARAFFGQT